MEKVAPAADRAGGLKSGAVMGSGTASHSK